MSRPPEPEREREPAEYLYGVHPVMEALESRSLELEKLWIAREREPRLGRMLRLAREVGVPVSRLPARSLARRAGRERNHQGVLAQVSAFPYVGLEELLAELCSAPEGRLVVLADRVVDPRNLGAMVRTCAAVGADGMVLSAGETVGLTSVVARTAAGALGRLPVARSARPRKVLRELAGSGYRIFALDPGGRARWDRVDWTGPAVLIAGGEERGARPSVLEECHETVAIPMENRQDSLNAAVALGVCLFEAKRQRGARNPRP